MPKKIVEPNHVAEALALRQAGYTALAISQRLGVSVRTLHRAFEVHGVKRGAIKQELLDAAKLALMQRVTSDDAIREEVAQIICDDLAHARHLRSLLVDASEHLRATTLSEAAQVMRAAAAYSTALKNSSDMLRQSLRVERVKVEADTELPELAIYELTAEDVAELRGRDVASLAYHDVVSEDSPEEVA